jgi:hypothetical protein
MPDRDGQENDSLDKELDTLLSSSRWSGWEEKGVLSATPVWGEALSQFMLPHSIHEQFPNASCGETDGACDQKNCWHEGFILERDYQKGCNQKIEASKETKNLSLLLKTDTAAECLKQSAVLWFMVHRKRLSLRPAQLRIRGERLPLHSFSWNSQRTGDAPLVRLGRLSCLYPVMFQVMRSADCLLVPDGSWVRIGERICTEDHHHLAVPARCLLP